VDMSESVTVLVASESRARDAVPGGWFRAASKCSCQRDKVSSLELHGNPLALLMVGGVCSSTVKWANFNGVIYIHYAAPPYLARSSVICHLPFGKVWFGSVCRGKAWQ